MEQTETKSAGPDSWTDEQVVSRVLAGQTKLFEVIVRRHSRKLYRVAVAVVRNESDAEDVVQDALCSAFQHLSQFAQRASFTTWLTRIALYRALANMRSKRREVPLDDGDGQPLAMFAHRGPSPEQVFCAKQEAVVLRSAIQALPPNYRRVLLMRDIDEVDTATTARKLRLTQTNVKVRLHRARTMLRRETHRAFLPAHAAGCKTLGKLRLQGEM